MRCVECKYWVHDTNNVFSILNTENMKRCSNIPGPKCHGLCGFGSNPGPVNASDPCTRKLDEDLDVSAYVRRIDMLTYKEVETQKI